MKGVEPLQEASSMVAELCEAVESLLFERSKLDEDVKFYKRKNEVHSAV